MKWWVYIIIFLLTQTVGSGAGILLGHLGTPLEQTLTASLMTANLLAIAVTLWLRPAGLTWRHTVEGWTVPAHRRITVQALLMAPPAILLVNLIGEWMPAPPDFIGDETLLAIMGSTAGIITMSIAGPIAEELLFRAGVMGRHISFSGSSEAATKGTGWKTIVLSALAFSIAHMNPAQMPVSFVLGLLLGWAYASSRSLLAPCIIHIFNNSCAVALAIAFKDPDVTLTGLLGSTAATVAVTLACTAWIAAACLFFHRKPSENR